VLVLVGNLYVDNPTQESDMSIIAAGIDPVTYFCGLLGKNISEVCALAKTALDGAEDGEIYFERTETEILSIDDARIESPDRSVSQGFGLRRVSGQSVFYAHDDVITADAILHVGAELRAIDKHSRLYVPQAKRTAIPSFYGDTLATPHLVDCVKLLQEIDAYARTHEVVTNVSVTLLGALSYILIVRADDTHEYDIRPMTRLYITIQCTDGSSRESTNEIVSGRDEYNRVSRENIWKPEVDLLLKKTKDKLRAKPCPSGQMPVILAPGWAAIFLHEAFGHGLEADFVWRKTTVFADLLGKRVASNVVNVVDDGTIPRARGSLNIDDEGTPTERTVLIQDGILVGYMHDRQSARLLGAHATGNARRESYRHHPQVRMRSTLLLGGESTPEEIIAATQYGIYMASFEGGQVDTVTGQFVFNSDLAYMVVDGKIQDPVIGATLIGNCATALLHVDMVGNDFAISGAGSCGKGGQTVPVGVGQPTLRLSGGITVGGTEVSQTEGAHSDN